MLRTELRELLELAVPIALANLGVMAMGFVDIVMLGRYSGAALAGAGMANVVFMMFQVIGMGAVMGLDTLVPQAIGAGEPERARRLLWVGVKLGVYLGIPITALCAASAWIYPAFGVEAGAAREATIYTLWRLPSVIPVLVLAALRQYLQGVSITRPLVVSMIAGNAFNVVINAALIFGVPSLGIPELGTAGAAVASDVVAVVMAAILAWSIKQIDVTPSDEPEGPLLRKTLRLGLPVGLQYAAEVGAFAVAGVLAGRIGRHEAAAHQVALLLASVVFNVALALTSAAAVRVGRAIGAEDAPGTRRAGVASLIAVGCVMVASATIMALFPELLARMVTDDADVIAVAVLLIQIAAVFQLSDGAQAVGAGVLRGAGDTRAAFVSNVVGHYGIGLPLAIWLAFGRGWSTPGLWWGLSAGLTAVAIFLWSRFFWKARKPIARS